ncbi:MAG: regulatory protein RecX [Gordonia sp. (in: high G+C Gram-positive bacteria)]
MSSPRPTAATGEGPSAWDAALRLLGVRARSAAEMIERLTRRGFDADTVDDVMRRLRAAGLLDDADFATEWIRSRHANAGRGRLALRHELRAKGVDAAIIEDALAGIEPDDERTSAVALVARKLTPSLIADAGAGPAERDQVLRRLVGMLLRRGFASSLAFDVAAAALDEKIAEHHR